MENWTEPEYDRDRVDGAGETLIGGEPTDKESHRQLDEAREVVNNWRAAHRFPLNNMQVTLRNRATSVDGNAAVAQRLKRLRSIKDKLNRLDWLTLSQMQDIGGCRAVVGSIDDLLKLDDLYQERDKDVMSRMHKRDNHLDPPKDDGYRSIHYVYEYQATRSHLESFNGLRTEIQLRSTRQHWWATATETVSTFTEQDLKRGRGWEDWERFFALVSNYLAMKEGCPLVPGTPDSVDETIEAITEYEQDLRVRRRLRGWQTGMDHIPAESTGKWNLLILNIDENYLAIRRFNNKSEADEQYMKLETETEDRDDVDAVLVQSDSVASMERAYPNYYVDMDSFIGLLANVVRRKE